MKMHKKKNTNILIFTLVVVLFCNCFITAKCSDENIITITPQYTSQQLDSIKKIFIETGDENAYVEYYGYRNDDELMYSLYMANTYNSTIAQYRIYQIMTEFYNNIGVEIDSLTNALAISYLKRSAEQNNFYAQCELSRLLLYGKGVTQDTIAAKEYIYRAYEKKKADKIWFINKRDYLNSLKKE